MPKGQSKMDNTLENAEGAIKNGQYARECRRGNQKWTIQKNWQHRVHKTQTNKNKNAAHYVLDTTIRKQTEITQIRTEHRFYAEMIFPRQVYCALCNFLI